MKRLLTYGWLLLTLLASLFVVSACQKEEVSKNEVMLTFNTRSDVADAKSDATTDVESMQELRVIMVNQDGTIIDNQNKQIATDQTQETFNFQAPVKNGNESFTFFAIANESSIVPDNLSWIKQSTGTLFANSINERKTTQIGNDAVFDFSRHIPQTKIWEVSYSEIKESGGNLSITKQLEYVTGKISVHFVNQTNEQQTISNIRILGITPNTKGYLFAQNSNDYVQSDLTGDNVNVIHFDAMDDASDDVTLSAPSNENASPSDSVEYYTYPVDNGNISSPTLPTLHATWNGKNYSLPLEGFAELKRNDHLKIIVTLTGQELVVNYSIAPWVEKLTNIGSPTIGGGYNTEDWTAGGDVNIGGDPVEPDEPDVPDTPVGEDEVTVWGDKVGEGSQEINWSEEGKNLVVELSWLENAATITGPEGKEGILMYAYINFTGTGNMQIRKVGDINNTQYDGLYLNNSKTGWIGGLSSEKISVFIPNDVVDTQFYFSGQNYTIKKVTVVK